MGTTSAWNKEERKRKVKWKEQIIKKERKNGRKKRKSLNTKTE